MPTEALSGIREEILNSPEGVAMFPGSCVWVYKKELGTHCLHMISSSRISGNLEIFVKFALLH